MPTNFPTDLDDASNLPDDKAGSDSRVGFLAGWINTASGAIRALEAKVGKDGSAEATSLDYLIKAAEDPGHTHTDIGGGGQTDPTLFLVNGTDYALTRAGVQAAIDAAEAVRGTVRLCGDVTSDGTPIDIDAPLTFDFGGHVIKAPADATAVIGLVTVIGTLAGTAHALTADAAIGDIEVELDTGEGASYAAGDYVFIEQPESEGATKFYAQICQVREVSGDTLVLADALKHDFAMAQFAWLRKWTPIEGVKIVNARFNGNGNTGATTRAIYLVDARDCVVEAEVTGFSTGAGIIADRGLRNTFRPLSCDSGDGEDTGGDGDGTESDVLLFRQTSYVLDCPFSDSASGFGAQSFGGVMGRWLFPRSTGANNRGLKLAHEGFTTMVAPRADASLNGYTGISLTLFSHDITLLAPDGHGNDSYSLMIDACDRVKVFGGRFDTVTVDDIDGACTDIELLQCSIATLTNNLAVDAVRIENAVRRDFADAAGDPTKSGQLQRNGTKLLYHNGSSAIDLTTGPSHGHTSHTDRTRRIALVPVNAAGPLSGSDWSADSGAGAILDPFPWSCDAHGSFSTFSGHVDIADNIANWPKINFVLPCPEDYVSDGRIVIRWSTPATSGNGIWVMRVREDFTNGDMGSAGYSTILNEGTANVGFITQTIGGSANIRREVKSAVFPGTQPTPGRMLEISVWSPSNHANDTLSAQRTFWGAWLEYTADM